MPESFIPKEEPHEVRLVFKDKRAGQVFIHYLTQVQAGKAHCPSLAIPLDRLAEPPTLKSLVPDA